MPMLFEAQGLVKYYTRRAVVDHVSFDVDRGEAVGMLGPNGAGKTTAFRMCIGLIRPAAGSVFFDGTDVTHMPMYRRARLGMSYLAQEPSLFQNMSVAENLLAVMEMQGRRLAERRAKTREMLGEFGLRHLKDQPAIRREIETKVPPLLAQGGYVPLADGRVRANVPLANYLYYRRLLEEITRA